MKQGLSPALLSKDAARRRVVRRPLALKSKRTYAKHRSFSFSVSRSHPSDSPVWCNVFAISYSSSSNTLKESSLSIYDHSFPAPTSYETSQVRIEFSPTNIGGTYHSGADILQSTRRYRINVIYIKCHCLCGFFLSPTSDLKQITFRVCNIEISYTKWEGFRFSRK